MKKRTAPLMLLLMALLLTGCAAKAQTRTVYAMDTVLRLTAYGKDADAALDDAAERLYALDALLDRHSEKSAVSALNRGGYTEDATLVQLIQDALSLSAETFGAFDPTLAPVLEAWGFGGESFRVPSDDELARLLEKTGAENVSVSGDTTSVTLAPGTQIDLGGIAKGYAGDCVKEIFENHGCTGTIDLGGDVVLCGKKTDGSDWRVAVKDPRDPSDFLGTLTAADCAVVTSGAYERYFTQGGVAYHHILDPETGRPAESGLVSVTVICGYGEAADALSTALFVMGADAAEELCRKAFSAGLDSNHLPSDRTLFSYILVTDDNRVLYSGSLADSFTPNEKSGYTYEELT